MPPSGELRPRAAVPPARLRVPVRLDPPEALDPAAHGSEAEHLEARLRAAIVGQDAAIEKIVAAYQMYLSGMTPPYRPVGNFLFLGPTGSGKTRIVEATAEILLNNTRAAIKIDCAEFQHSHEIAKLVGSPPGYLGHRETHALLSQLVLNQYHTETCKLSFILFDEIEKASDALWNLLLGILDKGTLTLGDNQKVDFSKCLIFMTSNLGATEMSALVNPRMGFAPPPGPVSVRLKDKVARAGLAAAKKKFTPEFMNRLDHTVVFNSLGVAELERVLEIELAIVQERIYHRASLSSFIFTATGAAKAFLLREGTDLKYGARHLKRAIERLLVQPLSNLMASEQLEGGDSVRVDHLAGAAQMNFSRDAANVFVPENFAPAAARTR